MKIALDIDDTITKYPDFFMQLSQRFDCVVVTSRSYSEENKAATESELAEYKITYSKLYFCDWSLENERLVPDALQGPKRLLFQKIIAFQKEEVSVVVDDDPTVHELVKEFLPQVALLSPV